MNSVLLKITCLAVGLLWLLAGCGFAVDNTGLTATPAATDTVSTFAGVVTPTPTGANLDSAAVAAIVDTPTPTSTPLPTATPTPSIPALPIPTPDGPPYSYHTIGEGETLGYIALLYDTTLEELVAMNNLDGPSALIQTGQLLRVPLHIDNISPAAPMLPDSEVVYSPAFVDFNVAEYVNNRGGYLSTYYESVDGEELTGSQVVERVARQFSIGPRLLLALLEHYGGWVTNPSPTEEQLRLPLGPRNPKGGSLYQALSFTANRINAGYYGYKRDGFWVFQMPDRSRAITPQGINAGTVGLQNILAIHSDWETWQREIAPQGFMAGYQKMFGDPFAYAVQPVVPFNLIQPPLSLPWTKGEGFYFTGGPHPAYADGSAWAAIDFGPPDVLGNCFYSEYPNTAVADGVIVSAREGEVYLDLDGDGNIQTGWVLLYLHVALDSDRPVQVGQQVKQGDIIGYASCEGGLSNSSHLHLARRYNGEWLDAGGPVPLTLAGWQVQTNLFPYEGFISNGIDVREACECWDAEMNLIVNTE
jgi:murein DD-endopeptidase MepM/ murein hydrolase activator NlpD